MSNKNNGTLSSSLLSDDTAIAVASFSSDQMHGLLSEFRKSYDEKLKYFEHLGSTDVDTLKVCLVKWFYLLVIHSFNLNN